MAKQPSTKKKLTLQQEQFCWYFVHGGTITETIDGKQTSRKFRMGNATLSYGKAYQKDIGSDKQYWVCSTEGRKNLRKPQLQEKIDELLKNTGVTEDMVDGRLMDIILNGDDSDSNTAIKEYNRLKKRGELTDDEDNPYDKKVEVEITVVTRADVEREQREAAGKTD